MKNSYSILLTVAMFLSGCATNTVTETGVSTAVGQENTAKTGLSTTVDLGDPESENLHNVDAEHAPLVSEIYPEYWIMSARASAYKKGCEPYRVIDGDESTHWEVIGPSPHPMAGGHWMDLELNDLRTVHEISIKWLGGEPYDFIIYQQPWSDATNIRRMYTGRSLGQSQERETYTFPQTRTRSIRIEFAAGEEGVPRGIKEVRIGGLQWPASYTPAAYPDAVAEEIARPFYVEFERFLLWPQFNLKRPIADGGAARRILPREDAFEGGYVDFDIAIDPTAKNWITLKIWESHHELMTVRGDSIVLEALVDDPDRNRRWFLPQFMTEKQNWNHEWYGIKPAPGRWVYASYALPEDITEGNSQIRLRLQGAGNDRRDYPMLNPAPPVYAIHSHHMPFFTELP